MEKRRFYVIQPYKVGTKNGESLAMIIPARFAKDNHIDTSTIFILRNEENQTGKIILKRMRNIKDEELMTPADESFQASSQQVSLGDK